MPFTTNRYTPPSVVQRPQQNPFAASAPKTMSMMQQRPAPMPVAQPAPRLVAQPAPQPKFNLPTPVNAPVSPQQPIGSFFTPPPAPTPPVSNGNFGTIQSQPAPISQVAIPTPAPVPAPLPQQPMDTGMMMPGSMGDQMSQQGGMNALPGMGSPISPVGGFGGPPQMQLQDYLNMGIDPATAQSMMSGTYNGGSIQVPGL